MTERCEQCERYRQALAEYQAEAERTINELHERLKAKDEALRLYERMVEDFRQEQASSD